MRGTGGREVGSVVLMGKSRNLEAENQAWCFCSVYLLGDSGGRVEAGMGLKDPKLQFSQKQR